MIKSHIVVKRMVSLQKVSFHSLFDRVDGISDMGRDKIRECMQGSSVLGYLRQVFSSSSGALESPRRKVFHCLTVVVESLFVLSVRL
jgi:hypothetical protein